MQQKYVETDLPLFNLLMPIETRENTISPQLALPWLALSRTKMSLHYSNTQCYKSCSIVNH
jgi:hypothetical protein